MKLSVVDLARYDSGDVQQRSSVVATIASACEQNGFFQLINHGVPLDLRKEILNAAQGLFGLPEADKLDLSLSNSPKNRGYSGVENQQLDPNGRPDLKESFYISEDTAESGNLYPSKTTLPDFHKTTATYYKAMINVSQRIFRLLALALGQELEFFDHYSGADGTFSSTFGSTLRLVHYPAPRCLKDGQLSCGAHTDFGTITILLVDEVRGLELLNQSSGEWESVDYSEDAFIVNIRDLMQRWSNHRFVSAYHRVRSHGPGSRYSVPFFFNGNYAFRIDPILATGKVSTNEPSRYGSITVGEHIRKRIRDTHVDVAKGDPQQAVHSSG